MDQENLPTIYRVADARPLTWGGAMQAWAPIAQRVLYETSVSDRATITLDELAEMVQSESGIRTREPVEVWINRLTDRVAAADPDIPIPAAPVPAKARAARKSGATRTTASKPASSAASGPGAPAARKPAAAPKRKASEVPPAICPTCFMALPASGICDTCG